MGFFGRLFNRAKSWTQLKLYFGVAGDSDRWKKLSARQLQELYSKSSLVYGAIREIQTTAPEAVPELISNEGKDNEREVDSHEVIGLLEKPNPLYTYDLFIQYITMRLLATGAAFVWKWRNSFGQVTEMWPVPTNWVTVITGKGNNLIVGFEVKQGSTPVFVPARDMLYCFFPDPANTYGYLAPLAAASRDVQIEDQRETYLAEMFANTKVPGLVLESEQELDPRTRKDLRAALKDMAGVGRRGGDLILDGGLKAHMEAPLADMDWPGLSAMTESRICMVFGVPPILIGARVGLDRSTFSNYKEARESFYKETMLPFWNFLAGFFTASLLDAEGYTDLSFRFNIASIEPLHEEAAARASRAVMLWQGSLATRDEAREIAGLSLLGAPAGDVILSNIAYVEIPVDELGAPTEEKKPVPDTGPPPDSDEPPAEGESDTAPGGGSTPSKDTDEEG